MPSSAEREVGERSARGRARPADGGSLRHCDQGRYDFARVGRLDTSLPFSDATLSTSSSELPRAAAHLRIACRDARDPDPTGPGVEMGHASVLETMRYSPVPTKRPLAQPSSLFTGQHTACAAHLLRVCSPRGAWVGAGAMSWISSSPCPSARWEYPTYCELSATKGSGLRGVPWVVSSSSTACEPSRSRARGQTGGCGAAARAVGRAAGRARPSRDSPARARPRRRPRA